LQIYNFKKHKTMLLTSPEISSKFIPQDKANQLNNFLQNY
jgi:hypothetical protein